MFPEGFLEELATKRGISNSELEALSLAVDGQTTDEIATKLGISPAAVRKRLSEVYKEFDIRGDGPGKLAQLQQKLISLYREVREANFYPSWGKIPESSDNFYGRIEQLHTLEKWIEEDNCRIVTILGVEGIGKTSLGVELFKRIKNNFKYFLGWYSLHRATSIEVFLDTLLGSFTLPKSELQGDGIDSKIEMLIKQLRSYRCLLFLDDVEAILNNDKDVVKDYREGYEKYRDLFQRLGEEFHQSCLILIGLEKPKEVSLLESRNSLVRSLLLGALEEKSASKILELNGLSKDDDWKKLIQYYSGNPLALKIISGYILDLFGGSVKNFIQYNTLIVTDINNLLYLQFARLSELEKDIMYCLAIGQESVPLSEIKESLSKLTSPVELVETLRSLKQRSLIESEEKKSSFTLQRVIMDFVTARLVEQICKEIESQPSQDKDDTIKIDKIQLLRKHNLFKEHTQGNTNEGLDNFILTPICNELTTIYRSEKLFQDKLSEIAGLLQKESQLEVGYASGNVSNLLKRLKTDSKQAP